MARRVYGSIADVLDAYVSGHAEYGIAGNVYFEKDVVYSYGSHFPMAVRLPNGMYICNGDKYSVTTSGHQSALFQRIPNRQRVEIPFSALVSLRGGGTWSSSYYALEVVRALKVLDWESDRYIDTGRDDVKGNRIYEHVLGACLFTYKGAYWLSGLDSTGVGQVGLFYLTKLSPTQMKKLGKPKTVGDALELLKPDEVREAEAAGKRVLRQGEWFFVEYEGAGPFKGDVEKRVALIHRNSKREARHVVTEGVRVSSRFQLARGVVRHGLQRTATNWRGETYTYRDRPEHKQLKLYDEGTPVKERKWFRAFESPQVVSFTAVGGVD